MIAREIGDMAIVRSMSTKEGTTAGPPSTSAPATCRTGPIQYPSFGSLVAQEFERDDAELPNFVSVAPFRFFNPAAFGPGFLGPQYAPLVVGEQSLRPGPADGVAEGRGPRQPRRRRPRPGRRPARPARRLRGRFLARHPGVSPLSHRMAYQRAVRMMRSPAVKAFDLDARTRSSATPTAATSSARAACWPAGWSSAGCRSSR